MKVSRKQTSSQALSSAEVQASSLIAPLYPNSFEPASAPRGNISSSGQRSQARAGSQNFKQRAHPKSINYVVTHQQAQQHQRASIIQQQQYKRASGNIGGEGYGNFSNQEILLTDVNSSLLEQKGNIDRKLMNREAYTQPQLGSSSASILKRNVNIVTSSSASLNQNPVGIENLTPSAKGLGSHHRHGNESIIAGVSQNLKLPHKESNFSYSGVCSQLENYPYTNKASFMQNSSAYKAANFYQQPNQDSQKTSQDKIQVGLSSGSQMIQLNGFTQLTQSGSYSQAANGQPQQRPLLFGNAVLQQNLMSNDTSLNESDSNKLISGSVSIGNMAKGRVRQQTAKYAQGNPARALRQKVKTEIVATTQQQQQHTINNNDNNILIVQTAGQSIAQPQRQTTQQQHRRPQSSSIPTHNFKQSGSSTIKIVHELSNVQLANRNSSTEKPHATGINQQYQVASQFLPNNSSSELIQVIGITQRSFDQNLSGPQSLNQTQQQFFDKRRVNQSRSGGLTFQYNSSQTLNSSKPPQFASTPHNGSHTNQASFLEQNQMSAIKKQDGIQLLPSTNKHYKNTKREYFARRMSNMDKPLIIINFQGVIGDFYKPQAFPTNLLTKDQQAQEQANIYSNLHIRVGSAMGLKFLSRNFQLVILNTFNTTQLQNQKDLSNKIQAFFSTIEVMIDAIYSIGSNNEVKPLISEDYSQIFIDFNINSMKKVLEKVVFLSSLNADVMGGFEQLPINQQGHFLFDCASSPPEPLVNGIPLTLKFNQSKDQKEESGLNPTKQMPLLILVPNFRGQYNIFAHQISFISIVKCIMSIAILSQNKNKSVQFDFEKFKTLKEWDLRLNGTYIALNFYEQEPNSSEIQQEVHQELKENECESTQTSLLTGANEIPTAHNGGGQSHGTFIGKFHKQIKSFHQASSAVSSSSTIDIQNMHQRSTRSPSCNSDDNLSRIKAIKEMKVSQQIINLNEQFFSSINLSKFLELQNETEQFTPLGMKTISTDIVFRYTKNQFEQKSRLTRARES